MYLTNLPFDMLYEKVYPQFMEKIQRKKYRQIIRQIKPKGKILDVACGPGFGADVLPHAVFTDKNLEYLRSFKGLRVFADANYLPFKNRSFDMALCIDFIHLMKNTDELKRISKKLIVSAFCNENNYQEKLYWLKSLFPEAKIENEFVARTEREWDAIIVLSFETK